ncbi:MAG: VOC family protein [Geothrix sp.]|uniref:VOC family protein n=1 Tax=Geothrix sp. TaxID=1962974 RepID=UPI001853433E|nr:VOC family protein [Geothrix sp.]NWJ42575.1 VOC family protein [Geothrix sp.]WIL19465.1 MAG: VOC family protein [Geothrix sp.]
MSGNPVAWFEIYVQDMARARAFYQAVFQVAFRQLSAPLDELEMWAFPSDMDRYGSAGTLVKMAGVPSGGMGTLVYFHCEDCAVEEARVVPAGGRVHRPKMAIGEFGFISLLHDTEGNMIGLHSMQ